MIHIIWPTVRYEAAAKMAALWHGRAAEKESHRFIFGVNYHPLYSDTGAPLFAFLDTCNSALMIIHDQPEDRKGCCWSATKISRKIDYRDSDIIILASDDWEPPEKWDEHITVELCKEANKDRQVLICNDGYAPSTNIIGLPIMNGWVLRHVLNGVIYHPAYCHMFSDQELFDICTAGGLVTNLRGTGSQSFTHLHWSFMQTQPDEHNNAVSALWEKDKATYYARKELSLEEKLKLPEGWKD